MINPSLLRKSHYVHHTPKLISSISTILFYIHYGEKISLQKYGLEGDTYRKLIEVTKSANWKQCTQFPSQSTSRRWEDYKKKKLGTKLSDRKRQDQIKASVEMMVVGMRWWKRKVRERGSILTCTVHRTSFFRFKQKTNFVFCSFKGRTAEITLHK